tara:strand:- start:709 stop:1185 length:477 start_codon:yes stop_codon:yes gene_type:complete
LSVPDQDEVVAAYGEHAGMWPRVNIACRAFVFSFYRFALFKVYRSVDVPRIRCVGYERLIFVGCWMITLVLAMSAMVHIELFWLGLVTFIVFGIVMSWLYSRAVQGLVHTRMNQCRSCGYDLAGLASVGVIEREGTQYDIGCALCPECGAEYPRVRSA